MTTVSAIESVGIRTEGQVELEYTSKDTYAKVLALSLSSSLGAAALRVAKSKNKSKEQ